jgi:PadR family transcriptional regulator, regulatory protein PadR
MKGTYLGEFEELVLLTVAILNGDAYGITVMDEIEKNIDRKVTVSTVHTALYRLEEKGFVESYFGGATQERGGRKKRLYKVTTAGQRSLAEVKEQREKLWSLMPNLKLNYE